jgi:hypothetical protein
MKRDSDVKVSVQKLLQRHDKRLSRRLSERSEKKSVSGVRPNDFAKKKRECV